MMPAMIINPNNTDEKPKYVVSIREAHNGFAVEIDQEIIPVRPMSQAEAERKMGRFARSMEQRINSGSDEKLMSIRDKAAEDDEKEENPINILGLHVFKTYSEMTAFLSFVYTNEAPVVRKKRNTI